MTQPYYSLKRELNVPAQPFVVLSYGEDEKPNVLRGLAKTHWCAHVPFDDEMRTKSLAIQHAASMLPDCVAEIARDNVANIRNNPREPHASADIRKKLKVWQPDSAAKKLGPVLAAFGIDQSELSPANNIWLAGDEVSFHVDEMLAEDRAFVIWMVAGPDKVLEFPGLGAGVPLRVGDAVLFDGMQPHGVRRPEKAGKAFEQNSEHFKSVEDVAPEDIAVFLSIDVQLTPRLCEMLSIETHETFDSVEEASFKVEPYSGITRLSGFYPTA